MTNLDQGFDEQDFAGTKPPCDVVMKGGITSGTVYPLAVVELAKRYRLSSIGGTSAGAIAAAVTAAAEFAREKGGYLRVAEIPNEISVNLLRLFQPRPHLRPLFNILVAVMSAKSKTGKVIGAVLAAVKGYPIHAALIPGLVLVAGIGLLPYGGWTAFTVLVALILSMILLGWRIFGALTRELPDSGWGMCRGRTEEGHEFPALTDWLADKIDEVAGRAPRQDTPLTFGDLQSTSRAHPINLQVMTTNLSMRRPYSLPFRDRTYLFRENEMRDLFPDHVVDQMMRGTKAFHKNGEATPYKDFYHFPDAEALPIVVAARMSLSFPGLISAVPLWTRDYTLKSSHGGDREEPRLCWFSDGGLSSNFPIHLFDRLWPNAPTFAIALEEHVQERHGEERVRLPSSARQGILLPVYPIRGLGNFLMTLLNAAKDWQDNLQSVLPGYRERVVRVALKPDEGGLNLTMDAETIRRLTDLGQQAGQKAGTEFSLDEHRWRRFLVAMARVEETLEELKDAHDPSDAAKFGRFLQTCPAKVESYEPASDEWLTEALKRAEELVQMGARWEGSPRIRDGKIPRPDSDMRITPKA